MLSQRARVLILSCGMGLLVSGCLALDQLAGLFVMLVEIAITARSQAWTQRQTG